MFQGWFARPSSSVFRKINELNQDKQEWVAGQQGRSHKGSQALASVYRSTKSDVLNQVTIELENAEAEAASAMQLADTQQRTWNDDRQSSRKSRAAKAFQEGMTTFAEFLESFSGVVEVVRVADDQYGGLAYGTLSVFVGVFVKKTQREEGLVEGFEELSHAFPRLFTLRKLGATRESRTPEEVEALEQLEKLLTGTFALVVIFAREATQYYASRTRRLKDIFAPDRLKSGTFVQIRDHLKRISEQCNILSLAQMESLHKKTDSIIQFTAGRGDLRPKSAAIGACESKLRIMLRIGTKSTNASPEALDSLGSLLRDTFSGRHFGNESPEPMSLSLLKADIAFSGWRETENSRLFLTGGINWRSEASTGTLNWLSESALLVIKKLREENKDVAYYLVQTTTRISMAHRRSLRDLMANVIFQVALMCDDSLGSQLDNVETLVNSSVWAENDADVFMEASRNLLLRIFSTFEPQRQIWIVIDRLDKCGWSDDDDMDEMDAMTALESLLSIVSEVACCVKILVTVDAQFARTFEYAGPPLLRRARQCLMLKPQWRQESTKNRIS